jgi:hypothetical protein
MRGSLLFTLFYLFVAAWAGGYQGCLERVWLYQAYLIDSLNDYDDQTLGWQCKGKNFKKSELKCLKWDRMVGHMYMHILLEQTDSFGIPTTSREAKEVRHCPTISSYSL